MNPRAWLLPAHAAAYLTGRLIGALICRACRKGARA